jgi:hypothetical protein
MKEENWRGSRERGGLIIKKFIKDSSQVFIFSFHYPGDNKRGEERTLIST